MTGDGLIETLAAGAGREIAADPRFAGLRETIDAPHVIAVVATDHDHLYIGHRITPRRHAAQAGPLPRGRAGDGTAARTGSPSAARTPRTPARSRASPCRSRWRRCRHDR